MALCMLGECSTMLPAQVTGSTMTYEFRHVTCCVHLLPIVLSRPPFTFLASYSQTIVALSPVKSYLHTVSPHNMHQMPSMSRTLLSLSDFSLMLLKGRSWMLGAALSKSPSLSCLLSPVHIVKTKLCLGPPSSKMFGDC